MAVEEKTSTFGFLNENALVNTLVDAYASFSARRENLGLSNPGTVEGVSREVTRDVFLTNSMFTGLRAELSKTFSTQPMFQYSHGFSVGAQNVPAYNFMSTFGTPSTFLHGSIDSEGQLAARANYRWTNSWVTKTTTQIAPGQAMVSVDNDITGRDFSASLKAINPSVLDGGATGIFIGSYLQSVTPALSLGMEAFWQRTALTQGPDTALSYVAKYKGYDWIASAQIQAQGALSATYWRRLTDKVDVGTEVNLQFAPGMGRGGLMGGGMRKEGTATLGAKYDFRASTFRAQIDSTGKISALMEKRVVPLVTLTFAAELDQFEHQAKVGMAVSIESQSEELLEQHERAMNSGLQPPQPPPY